MLYLNKKMNLVPARTITMLVVLLLVTACASTANTTANSILDEPGWEAAPLPQAQSIDKQIEKQTDLPRARVLTDAQISELLERADQAYRSQRWESARKYYQQVVASHEDDLQALFRLGNIAILNRDLSAAQQYYERVLAINPNNSKAQYNLATVHLTKAEEHFQFYTATLNDEAVEPKLLALMREINRFSDLQPTEQTEQTPLDSLLQLLDSNN